QLRRGGAVIAADPCVLVAAFVTIVVIVVAVATIVALDLLLELRGLPVGAVAAILPDQLQVAVEALEARDAQRDRNLALQRAFRPIVRPAFRLRHRQRNRLVAIAVAIVVVRRY